jgi:hypothetical protein
MLVTSRHGDTHAAPATYACSAASRALVVVAAPAAVAVSAMCMYTASPLKADAIMDFFLI